MRASDRILWTCIAALFALATAALFWVRAAVHTRPQCESLVYTAGDTTVTYPLQGFSVVQALGPWRINAVRSDQVAVTVAADRTTLPYLKVSLHGDTLVLIDDAPKTAQRSTVSLSLRCPVLTSVTLTGTTSLSLAGFTQDELSMALTGTSRVSGAGMSVRKLSLTSAGALNLDFSRASTSQAYLDLRGAVYALLSVTGGPIDGSAAGTGHVVNFGEPSAINVKTSGLVSINKG